MDGISSRKLTWGICIVGIAIAIISSFSYRRLFPFTLLGMESQMTLAIRQKFFNADTPSGCYNLEWYKSIKYVLMHSKTWLTVGQYNLMIDCVLGIILIAEIFMIYASFV